MKKNLLTLAVSGVLFTPLVVNAAGDMQLYGTLHVGIENIGNGDSSWNMSTSGSKSNRIGVKGGVDTNLLDIKAIYQIEIGLNGEADNVRTTTNDATSNASDEGTFFQRDTWVGFNSRSLGTVQMGTVTTHYKQTGKMIDPLFTTAVEGRGALGMMSGLHGGLGAQQGRATNTVRYDIANVVPGLNATATYQLNSAVKNNIGVGASYNAGPATAFVSYVSGEDNTADDATATKVGVKAEFGGGIVGVHYEFDGGMISGDADDTTNVLFLNAAYKLAMTTLAVSYGMVSDMDGTKSGHGSFALAAMQQLARKTTAYATYGKRMENDSATDDTTIIAFGMMHHF